MTTLPDHAAEADDRALAIDRVGIKDLAYPIVVLDREARTQPTVATIDLYVGLPQHFKGTHMSRFVEVLNRHRGEMTMRNMPRLLTDMQERLEANDAHLEVRFPYFLSKRAPISGVESLMEYKCTFRAEKHGPDLTFTLCVRVPVKSLCPCSKAISERGAHNQRSLVDVEVQSDGHVWIEEVVEAVEACASAPLFALLKREDEKYVTELAYDNPRFVEDLVRDVVLKVRSLPGVSRLRVAAENQESIHNHSAYAEILWSREADGTRDLPATTLCAAHPSDAVATEPGPTFGVWLRQTREQRRYTQAALAEAIGVSNTVLSRVESDEKRLSEEAVERLAEAWGEDPARLRLRAGHIDDALLARISADPDGFLGWVRRA